MEVFGYIAGVSRYFRTGSCDLGAHTRRILTGRLYDSVPNMLRVKLQDRLLVIAYLLGDLKATEATVLS